MGDTTQIRVTKHQRDELHSMKNPGESYADILDRVFGVDKHE